MSLKIQVNHIAYRKMALHSLKYITEDVYGVLVGTVNQNNVQVQDVYPLFHSKFLTPLLETSFEFVDAITSKKNQVIIGWYESCVKNNENTTNVVTDVSHEVVENLSSKIPFPLLFSIKEIAVEDPEQPNNLEVRALLGKSGASGYEFQDISTGIENRFEMGTVDQDLISENHLRLVDFQTHLNNVESDFRNEFIH